MIAPVLVSALPHGRDGATAGAIPPRALPLALSALGAAVGLAWVFPRDLIDHEVLASILALVPAIVLAQYRGWTKVSLLLAAGMVLLTAVHLFLPHAATWPGNWPFILIVVAPYIAIALGAGWFGEVRRFQADLRDTQLQLIQSEKLDSVGRMAAGVAHEVKNPLMTIMVATKILAKRLPETDETSRLLLADMSDAVLRADRIISILLGYSRQGDLSLAEVDLNLLVERSLLLVKHELGRRRISVVTDLDPAVPPVMLDEFKVQQVLINVINNAMHVTLPHGTIHVRTTVQTLTRGGHVGNRQTDRFRPGERVVTMQVDDDGPGIQPDHLSRVFEPFFSTKPVGSGTGLGLSVSRQIVDLHGGVIELGNRENGGARATITLKLSGVSPK